jgi:glycosyltransferase involved in cell wall biosynthesis
VAVDLSFDLVVATVDRVDPLSRLFASLERQAYRRLRILVVDQNEDARLTAVLDAHPALDLVRLRSPRGLSRARNAALPHVTADLVAFPDDDCEYPDGLLERVAAALGDLDGLSGRTADDTGASAGRWSNAPGPVDAANVWHRVNSAALFLRRELVERTGPFDERLGLGAGGPWRSGEEVDYLVRALELGARVRYEPSLVVRHAQPAALSGLGFRDGASVGYLLRKHRYGPRTVARMLVRPAGGAVLAAARRDGDAVRFQAATLRGRLTGYLRAPS